MATEIVIAGISMVTALGLDAVQTAANVRAGMAGFKELAWLDKAFQPFIGAFLPDDVLDPLSEKIAKARALTYREDRVLRLAGLPLKEVIAGIKGRIRPLPLLVGMPENDQTFRLTDKDVLAYLPEQSGVPIDTSHSSVFFKGRAAGLLAVHAVETRASAVASIAICFRSIRVLIWLNHHFYSGSWWRRTSASSGSSGPPNGGE